MPLYRLNKEIEEECGRHAERDHPNVINVDFRTMGDGRIRCRQDMCLWISQRRMELSPNNTEVIDKNN